MVARRQGRGREINTETAAETQTQTKTPTCIKKYAVAGCAVDEGEGDEEGHHLHQPGQGTTPRKIQVSE